MLRLVLCFCMAWQVLGQVPSNSEDSVPNTMLGAPTPAPNIGDNIRNALRMMMSSNTATTSEPETVSRNRFINAFVILPTTTQTTTTVETDSELSATSTQEKPVLSSRNRLGSGSFIILPTIKTTTIMNPTERVENKTAEISTTTEDSETTPEPEEETTWEEYYTVLITTEGELDEIDLQTEAATRTSNEETTAQPTSKSSTEPKTNPLLSSTTLATSTRRTSPTPATRSTYPPLITIRTFPTRPTSTTTRKPSLTPKDTSNKVPGEATVFKNTGIKFIPLVPVAPSNPPRSYSSTRRPPIVPKATSRNRIQSKSTTKSPVGNKPVLVEVTEAYLPGVNGIGGIDDTRGVGFGGGIINGNLNPSQVTTSGDIGAVLIAGGPYYANPALFWAKYWYWILIGILLIIFFFIIPGCCCQIYFYRRYRRMRRKDSKQAKKSSEIDLEEGNVGSRVDSTDWNSDTDEGSQTAVDHNMIHNSSSPVSSLPHCPPSSLPEADIPQGREEKDRGSSPNQENRKVIEFPSDNLPRIIDLSASVSESAVNDYDFGYSPENNRGPYPDDYSEIKLDFANEAIIKSKTFNEPVPARDPLAPVLPRRDPNPPRPPKPRQLVPPVPQRDFVPQSRGKTDRQQRRSGGDKAIDHEAPAGRYRSPDRKKESTKRSGKTKKRESSKKKNESDPRKNKKKQSSNQQSLLEAAQSLENILEAISRLTKEYPIPKLPMEDDSKSKPRKDRKRVEKRTKDRSRRDKRAPKDDEDMFASKMKRTRRWADEQKRLDDPEDGEIERKRSSRRERREKGSPREETSRKKRRERSERREKKKSSDDVSRHDEKPSDHDKAKKVPTLMKIEPLEVNRTTEERQRVKLERDLAKLKRYHNQAAKKAEKETAEDDENATEMKETTPPAPLMPVVEAFDTTTT